MSKLDEAADKYSTYADDPQFVENDFKAGALWLLEEAKRRSGYYAESIRECVFLDELIELCEEPKE